MLISAVAALPREKRMRQFRVFRGANHNMLFVTDLRECHDRDPEVIQYRGLVGLALTIVIAHYSSLIIVSLSPAAVRASLAIAVPTFAPSFCAAPIATSTAARTPSTPETAPTPAAGT